jgi:hypothetical protein
MSPRRGPQLPAIANDERQRLPSNARCWAEVAVRRHPIAKPTKANSRASTCRAMTIPATGNSDAPSATAPCKLSVWSLVYRAYLPGYDVTLSGAQHVSSSPSKRSLSNSNHNASRWPPPSARLAPFLPASLPHYSLHSVVFFKRVITAFRVLGRTRSIGTRECHASGARTFGSSGIVLQQSMTRTVIWPDLASSAASRTAARRSPACELIPFRMNSCCKSHTMMFASAA